MGGPQAVIKNVICLSVSDLLLEGITARGRMWRLNFVTSRYVPTGPDVYSGPQPTVGWSCLLSRLLNAE